MPEHKIDRRPRLLLATIGTFVLFSAADAEVVAHARGREEPIGLSLWFRNGATPSVELVGSSLRFLQEVDITASFVTTTDQGIDPLIHGTEFSRLDWRGVQFVEEDWRAPGDGTFTRQRFYRGAKWMEKDSTFVAIPKDRRGRLAGTPLVFLAGKDDRSTPGDDGFVRRYVARQITFGCAAIGDCSGATTFIAEGLVQSRQELHPNRRAARIDERATRLDLIWSTDPGVTRSVGLTHADPDDHPFGYGFEPSIEILTPPANGQFYLPGDSISFRAVFEDGDGNPLTAPGSLPTYGDFLRGTAAGGLRYFDTSLNVTLYYGLKHREGNMLLSLSGPTDALKTPTQTVAFADFFAPQATIASVPFDGFSAVAEIIPAFPIILGGAQDPSIWETPIPDVRTLTLPADAKAGTYTVALKARRDWGGEALNRGATKTIQVGSATPTSFRPATGRCNDCHEGRASLGIVNHGMSERTTCPSCHAQLPFEPDAAIDIRVHFVHSRSQRVPGDVNDCSMCHLTPPSGPARGFPGVPF